MHYNQITSATAVSTKPHAQATAHRVDAGRMAEHFVVAVLEGLILGVVV